MAIGARLSFPMEKNKFPFRKFLRHELRQQKCRKWIHLTTNMLYVMEFMILSNMYPGMTQCRTRMGFVMTVVYCSGVKGVGGHKTRINHERESGLV